MRTHAIPGVEAGWEPSGSPRLPELALRLPRHVPAHTLHVAQRLWATETREPVICLGPLCALWVPGKCLPAGLPGGKGCRTQGLLVTIRCDLLDESQTQECNPTAPGKTGRAVRDSHQPLS